MKRRGILYLLIPHSGFSHCLLLKISNVEAHAIGYYITYPYRYRYNTPCVNV